MSHLSWSSFPLTTCSLQDPQVSPKGRSLRAQLSRFFFPTSMLVTGDSFVDLESFGPSFIEVRKAPSWL